jgi:hypothetical protein
MSNRLDDALLLSHVPTALTRVLLLSHVTTLRVSEGVLPTYTENLTDYHKSLLSTNTRAYLRSTAYRFARTIACVDQLAYLIVYVLARGV